MYSVSLSIFGVQQYMRTTAISNNLININIDDQGPMPSQFKFLPTNLNVQAGKNSAFLF